jgi:hypothetical protein
MHIMIAVIAVIAVIVVHGNLVGRICCPITTDQEIIS